MALSWPSRIEDTGALRTHFHHVVDVMPTILAAAGIETPSFVNGIEQLPVDGVSMLYTFNAGSAESTRTTQYFEMFGNRALYHDGWIASCYHGRVPWNRFGSFPFNGPEEKWELYNIREDFSQGNDLALEYPEKLQALREMFDEVAQQHNVYPLREPISSLGMRVLPPESLGGLKKCTYTSAHIRMPERSVVNLKNCSFRIAANIAVGNEGVRGVIACQGGNMAGWSLYLDDAGCPVYHYNWMGHNHYVARSAVPLTPGTHEVVIDFVYDGGFGAGGDAVLLVDGEAVAHVRVERTVPIIFSMSGESFDIGMDTGAPVGNYPHVYRFTGDIHEVTLERLNEPNPEIAARIAEGEFRASIATQ
jgi:arylsulfatase